MKIFGSYCQVRFHPAEVIGGLPAHKVKSATPNFLAILELTFADVLVDELP